MKKPSRSRKPKSSRVLRYQGWTMDQYLDAVEKFHGRMAPGAVLGGYMVTLAVQNLPRAKFYDCHLRDPVLSPRCHPVTHALHRGQRLAPPGGYRPLRPDLVRQRDRPRPPGFPGPGSARPLARAQGLGHEGKAQSRTGRSPGPPRHPESGNEIMQGGKGEGDPRLRPDTNKIFSPAPSAEKASGARDPGPAASVPVKSPSTPCSPELSGPRR